MLGKEALTSDSNGEGDIRTALMANGNLIDCIVNLPTKLFLNTQTSAALWFVNRARGKPNLDPHPPLMGREGSALSSNGHPHQNEILFIDARYLGQMLDRHTKELTPEDIQYIAATYHAWLASPVPEDHQASKRETAYRDIKGFCASVPLTRIQEMGYVLTPGRYIGLPEEEDDRNFTERFNSLKAEFENQLREEATLNIVIAENLEKVVI